MKYSTISFILLSVSTVFGKYTYDVKTNTSIIDDKKYSVAETKKIEICALNNGIVAHSDFDKESIKTCITTLNSKKDSTLPSDDGQCRCSSHLFGVSSEGACYCGEEASKIRKCAELTFDKQGEDILNKCVKETGAVPDKGNASNPIQSSIGYITSAAIGVIIMTLFA